MHSLSIIITHYKRPRLLLKLLKTLHNQVNDSEIIVVDSHANKGMRFLMEKEFSAVTYIPFSKNVGYAKLANAGIKASKGEYIFLLNADIIITPQNIEKIQSFLKNHKDAAAIGVTDCFRFPTIHTIIARRTFWRNTYWGRKELKRYELYDYDRKTPLKVDWVRGDCWMIKKDALNKIGLFDEQFFLYLEDTDWCKRAQKEGYGVYFLPGIETIQHHLGASRQRTLKGLAYRLTHLTSFFKYTLKWNK